MAGNRTHLHFVDGDSDDWTYYTYNIENQLTIEEKGGTATYYTYNPVGELIGKKVGEEESTYEYNFEGLMDEYASGESAVYFTYDADNRRILAKRNGTEEKYVLSDQDVVADYDEDDTLIATYNTPGLDSNLTKKISNNIYFYVADGLGSIRNLLDANEVAQNSYDYKAFGAIYGSPTENIANRYRFTAREWESIPSLHFYRARMMDQSLGRFLSKDPVRMSLNANHYVYSRNNPIRLLDPMGLYTVLFKGITCLPVKPYSPISSQSLIDAAGLLEGSGEKPTIVYEHERIGAAIQDIRAYYNQDEKRKKCEKLNVVGYSCGADSALSLVRSVANINELEDIEIASLIYLDFNFGAVKWPPCRHVKWGGRDNYSIPSSVKHKIHRVSVGTMNEGKRKLFPNIKDHTKDIWKRCPGPSWCDDLEVYLGIEAAAVERIEKIEDIKTFVSWNLTNTSGYYTDEYGVPAFPKDIPKEDFEGDHLGIGTSTKIPGWIKDTIISFKKSG